MGQYPPWEVSDEEAGPGKIGDGSDLRRSTAYLTSAAMESAIVGTKGQVVIPQKIRAMFRIKQGTCVHVEVRRDEIMLTPLTPQYFEQMAGCLGTGGKATKALLEERKRARKL